MIQSTAATANSTAPGTEVRQKRLKESCQDFEAVLIGFLLKSMRENVLKSDETDSASELYESMMDEAVARQMSRQEQLGLSQTICKALSPKAESEPGKNRRQLLDGRVPVCGKP